MSRLQEQLKQGVGQAWSSLTHGWRELRERAGDALTRFRHGEARPGGSSATERGAATWGLMAADVMVGAEQVLVRVEAPGMARDDLHVDIDADRVTVSGEKHFDRETTNGDCRVLQCAYGSFVRELALPVTVDAQHARASYRDGVLRIELPRRDKGRGRRITVHGG